MFYQFCGLLKNSTMAGKKLLPPIMRYAFSSHRHVLEGKLFVKNTALHNRTFLNFNLENMGKNYLPKKKKAAVKDDPQVTIMKGRKEKSRTSANDRLFKLRQSAQPNQLDSISSNILNAITSANNIQVRTITTSARNATRQDHSKKAAAVQEAKTKQVVTNHNNNVIVSPVANVIREEVKIGKDLVKQFPQPKNALHNIFDQIAKELNNKSYVLKPTYVTKKPFKGVVLWECTYHLKWPEDVKFTYSAITKQDASAKAALLALSYLKDKKKITNQFPVLHNLEELNLKEVETLTLRDTALKNLTDAIRVYEDSFLPELMGAMKIDDKESEERSLENDFKEDWPEFKRHKRTIYSPDFYYTKEPVVLPICSFKDQVIKEVQSNQVVIIKGEPGCGKSTRVPQYVLESWARDALDSDQDCRIIVTQPRRIAAISLAERVSNEREDHVGKTVGYQVRFKSNFNEKSGRILYCTTGILLRRLQSDAKLLDCSHIILDEAHERDVNTDLLLNLLKNAIKLNPNLKLIVMSATIDAEKFQKYFINAASVHIPGFTHPVKVNFLDEKKKLDKTMAMCNSGNPAVIYEDVAKLINHIHKQKPEGAILCFLPGWDDISKVKKLLANNVSDMYVLCLHSKVPDSEQKLIFSKPPPGVRKVILATNIAETSVTIDDIVYVIDTGIQKEKRFDVEKGIVCIDNCWISKASMAQRKGRAGRVQSGESFHLYTETMYDSFPDYSTPEILRTSLTKIVLDSKVYSNNMKATEFLCSLLTPPETAAIATAVEELKNLELLDGSENLTSLGRVLSEFQMEPKLGKAMVNSVIMKCVTPVVDIVTLFSAETDIFGRTLTDKEGINRVKKGFSRTSDHLSLMRIFEKWSEFEEYSDYRMIQNYCDANKLVDYKLKSLKQLRDVHYDYLHKGLLNVFPISDDNSDMDELVKAVLLSGIGQVLHYKSFDVVKGRVKKANILLTKNNHKATIASESVNYKRDNYPTNFVFYINETRSNIRRVTIVRETSLIPSLSVLLFKSNKLIIEEVPKEQNSADLKSSDQVVLKMEGTNVKIICDKTQANVILRNKEYLKSGMQYYVHQLTKGGEYNSNINKAWSKIVQSISAALQSYSV